MAANDGRDLSVSKLQGGRGFTATATTLGNPAIPSFLKGTRRRPIADNTPTDGEDPMGYLD